MTGEAGVTGDPLTALRWGLTHYEYARDFVAESDALADVEALIEAARYALFNAPGHSHWREGGAGGTCDACERGREVDRRLSAALARFPATSPAKERA